MCAFLVPIDKCIMQESDQVEKIKDSNINTTIKEMTDVFTVPVMHTENNSLCNYISNIEPVNRGMFKISLILFINYIQ